MKFVLNRYNCFYNALGIYNFNDLLLHLIDLNIY